MSNDFLDAAGQLSHSLARLASTTADYVGERLERLDETIQVERRRWFWRLFGAGVMLLWLGVASAFAGAAIVMAFWESSRVLATALVGTGFAAMAGLCATLLWNQSRRPPSSTDRLAQLLSMVIDSRRHR